MSTNIAAAESHQPPSASMRALKEDGYAIVRAAVPAELIAAIDRDLDPRYAATPFCEGGFYGERTKRFGRLLIRSPHIGALVMNPAILAIAEAALGDWCERIQLNLAQAIELHPGALPQFPHRDQDMWQGTLGEVEYLTSAAPILDALRYAGPVEAWRAAGDLARLANDNMWRALGYSAKRLLRPPPMWPVDHSLLTRRYARDYPEHPWMADADRASPGQQVYAIKLLIAQPFLDGYDRALAMPMIAPLLSQPIIEFTLGVPSWQWGEGGQNRALARRAFRQDLPEMVIERLGKGRILSVFLPAFEAHRRRLRSYLLDGWLAGAGLLDLEAVGALFADNVRPDPVMVTRILSFADIERWARSVSGHPDVAI